MTQLSGLEQDMADRVAAEHLLEEDKRREEERKREAEKRAHQEWFVKSVNKYLTKLLKQVNVTVEPENNQLHFEYKGEKFFIVYTERPDTEEHMYHNWWSLKKGSAWSQESAHLWSGYNPDDETDCYEKVLEGLKQLTTPKKEKYWR